MRSSLRRDCVAAAAFSASAISFRFASTCTHAASESMCAAGLNAAKAVSW